MSALMALADEHMTMTAESAEPGGFTRPGFLKAGAADVTSRCSDKGFVPTCGVDWRTGVTLMPTLSN
jgi:hypothetical protein